MSKKKIPSDIIIANPKRFDSLRQAFIKDGLDKVHVLSDFDWTLTRAFIGKEPAYSLLAVFRKDKYFSPSYYLKAQVLFDKYRPLEIDSKVSLGEKKRYMQEWWKEHFRLLVETKLTKQDLERAMKSTRIRFRKGASYFFRLLKAKSIPLVIMSSSGIGGDGIPFLLKRKGYLSQNVHIISNYFIWNREGHLKGVKKPIIHVANKDETLISDFPYVFKAVKNRKNVILLGDNATDVSMIDGFSYDNLIKIGFLNEKVKENLAKFKKIYDVVLLGDASMDFVNELLRGMGL